MTSSLIRAAPRSGGIEGMGGRAKLSLALRLALCALRSGARVVLYHDDILLCQCRANAAPKARHSERPLVATSPPCCRGRLFFASIVIVDADSHVMVMMVVSNAHHVMVVMMMSYPDPHPMMMMVMMVVTDLH
jgi:hypothetical protein